MYKVLLLFCSRPSPLPGPQSLLLRTERRRWWCPISLFQKRGWHNWWGAKGKGMERKGKKRPFALTDLRQGRAEKKNVQKIYKSRRRFPLPTHCVTHPQASPLLHSPQDGSGKSKGFGVGFTTGRRRRRRRVPYNRQKMAKRLR